MVRRLAPHFESLQMQLAATDWASGLAAQESESFMPDQRLKCHQRLQRHLELSVSGVRGPIHGKACPVLGPDTTVIRILLQIVEFGVTERVQGRFTGGQVLPEGDHDVAGGLVVDVVLAADDGGRTSQHQRQREPADLDAVGRGDRSVARG